MALTSSLAMSDISCNMMCVIASASVTVCFSWEKHEGERVYGVG